MVGESFAIGRGKENAVQIEDPSVSTLHARLDYRDGTYIRNGTEPIHKPQLLMDSDSIRLGRVSLSLRRKE
ncbi:MAG: FHA domain-containing protein [Nitrospirae bacterium]|nr:FHA domain-containing protein [Nitrospirota bacterium]